MRFFGNEMEIDRVIVHNGVTRYVLAIVRRHFCFGSIKIEAFRFYAVNSQYSWYTILQSVTAIVSMPTFEKQTKSLWDGIAHRSSSMRICLDDIQYCPKLSERWRTPKVFRSSRSVFFSLVKVIFSSWSQISHTSTSASISLPCCLLAQIEINQNIPRFVHVFHLLMFWPFFH